MEEGIAGAVTGELAQQSNTPEYFRNYEVLKTIGRGKFAVVYRARKENDDEVVALKRISVDMMNEKARDKCLKEVRLLQSLDHPNIIRYMDSFIVDNDLIIVYEWAAAGDLKRQLRKAIEKGVGFEERVIWKYFSQIALAMQHMHERRIMHRDLKPANIFLTLDGTIKVGDLGLSRELSEHTIQAHSKVGTPLYMSPEVLKGDGYDFKSDIWSLGCLLYELAMLRSPFKVDGLNMVLLFQKITNGEYLPLPERYSEDLRTLAYSMIANKPEDRPEIGYVTRISQQMRQQTMAERVNRSRTNSAASRTADGMDSNGEKLGLGATEPPAADEKEIPRVKESDYLASKPLKDNDQIAVDDNNEPGQQHSAQNRNLKNQKLIPKSAAKDDDDEEKLSSNPFRSTSATRREKDGEKAKEKEKDVENERRGDNTSMRGNDRRPSDVTIENFPVALSEYLDNKGKNSSDTRPGTEETTRFTMEFDNIPSSYPSRPKNEFDNYQKISSSEREIIVTATSSEPSQAPSQQPPVYRRSKQLQQVQPEAPPIKAKSQTQVKSLTKSPSQSNQDGAVASDDNYKRNSSSLTKNSSASKLPSTSTYYNNNNNNNSTANAEDIGNASTAFAVMDMLYSKLIVLGYPMDDPELVSEYATRDSRSRGRLLPIHFACSFQSLGNIAGHDRNSYMRQFKRMAHVAKWLCDLIGGETARCMENFDNEYSTAITMSKQILIACQRAGEMDAELTAIPSTSLAQGYGINVCMILNYLSDCALKATNFVAKPPVYSKADETFDNADSDGSVQDEDEDNSGVAEEDEIAKDDDNDTLASSMMSTSYRGRVIHENTGIDPILWQQEAERVAPQLKIAEISRLSAGSTWIMHIEKLLNYSKSIGTKSNSNSGNEAAISKENKNLDLKNMAESVHALQNVIANDLKSLGAGERAISNRPLISAIAADYSLFKSELTQLQERHGALNSNIIKLTSSLSEIEEAFEEAIKVMEERTGENGSSKTSPIIRIKEAIRLLQKEVQDMHVTTSILSNELLQKRREALINRTKSIKRKGKKSSKSEECLYDDL